MDEHGIIANTVRKEYESKLETLESEKARLKQERQKWFQKGRESVLRDNHSGCCCMFSEDESELLEPCGFHAVWRNEAVNKVNSEKAELEKENWQILKEKAILLEVVEDIASDGPENPNGKCCSEEEAAWRYCYDQANEVLENLHRSAEQYIKEKGDV